MAGLNLPTVEPSRFQVEVAEEYDGATTQQAGFNQPAWCHRGLGFLAGLAGFMVIAAVVFPSPSHTESPSGFSLASFTPAGMPAMRGTNAAATSSDQTPVMQMRSPMERSARIPTMSLRNTPPAMQVSSSAFDPLGLESSEESQAATAYGVPSSHINRMQPGQNIVDGDSGVSGSTLGWLSILALSTAGAYMAGKTVQSRGQPQEKPSRAATVTMSEMANPTATMDTSMGVIKVELFLDRVPVTASSFIDLCQTGFYDGIHFHRVIPGFMDQFGCPNAKDPKSGRAGTGGPPDGTFKNLKTGGTETRSNGGNIQDELISKDSNTEGTLSMANTGQPNSGGSQFFLNVANNANLDWFSSGPSKHPVFGKVVEGYDICVAISKVPTNNDRPKTPIKMNSITISGV